jgi:hypothetical protein
LFFEMTELGSGQRSELPEETALSRIVWADENINFREMRQRIPASDRVLAEVGSL